MAKAEIKALPSLFGAAELSALDDAEKSEVAQALCRFASEAMSDYYNINREAWKRLGEAINPCKKPTCGG